MGCLFALISAFSARLALFLVWVFTDRLTIAFSSGWEGIVGFIFLPYTTLFYALVYAPHKGVRRLRLGDRRPRDRARPVVAPVRLARCETSPGPARPAGAGGVARTRGQRSGWPQEKCRRRSGSGPNDGALGPTAASLCHPATPIMAALSVAIDWGWDEQAGAELVRQGLGARPQDRAGRHPADDGQGRVAELLERAAELGDQHVHAGGHEGRRHLLHDEGGVRPHVVDDGGLQAREGEGVAVGEHRAREAEPVLAGRRPAGRGPARPDSRVRGSGPPCRRPRRWSRRPSRPSSA